MIEYGVWLQSHRWNYLDHLTDSFRHVLEEDVIRRDAFQSGSLYSLLSIQHCPHSPVHARFLLQDASGDACTHSVKTG